MKYNLVSNGSGSNLTVFLDGAMYVADESHPQWTALVGKVAVGDETDLIGLFDPAIAVTEKFSKLGEQVSVSNGIVYFDGDPVDNSLTNQILRFLDEGHDFLPLVLFMEKLSANPQAHSREHLYRWLNAHDFTISDDGDIIGYKSVFSNGDSYQSVHSGTAIVDGVVTKGQIPNRPGSVIEMARSEVAFDPSQGCSYGLHVGTWDYAQTFSGDSKLKVKVNPRDVVSVPVDSGDQKLRCCRYTVIEKIDGPLSSALEAGYAALAASIYEDDDDEDEDEATYEYCQCCGDDVVLDAYGDCPDCGCGL